MITSFLLPEGAFAKTLSQMEVNQRVSVARQNLPKMQQAVLDYAGQHLQWPSDLQQLYDEGLIDGRDVRDAIEAKEYNFLNQNNRFAIGVAADIVDGAQLKRFITSIQTFAGYHWIFRDKPQDLKGAVDEASQSQSLNQSRSNERIQPFDYKDGYDRQLPFFSNTKWIVEGKIIR